MATLLSATEFLFIQQGEEIKNSGMASFVKNLVSLLFTKSTVYIFTHDYGDLENRILLINRITFFS